MLEEIIKLVEDKLCVEDVEITEATSFKDDLHTDSLDLFDLVVGIEEEYGIQIPSEDFDQLGTVGDVVTYIESHK